MQRRIHQLIARVRLLGQQLSDERIQHTDTYRRLEAEYDFRTQTLDGTVTTLHTRTRRLKHENVRLNGCVRNLTGTNARLEAENVRLAFENVRLAFENARLASENHKNKVAMLAASAVIASAVVAVWLFGGERQ